MITSSANKKIKNVAALLSRSRERKKQQLFVVEGIKMFTEAPISWIYEVYIDEMLQQQIQKKEVDAALLNKIEEIASHREISTEVVQTDIFKKMSDTQTPQGILCVLKRPSYEFDTILNGKDKKGLYLILEDIQDPGNLGTMLRAGEGAGISGVIMSAQTVDIFNPKTIRATMGSIYRVPFIYADDLGAAISKIKASGTKVYAAHLKGKKAYDCFDYKEPVAFLIGNEGNGLTDATADMADDYLIIPMLGEVESLNAAIAATLLTYEAARQRRN